MDILLKPFRSRLLWLLVGGLVSLFLLSKMGISRQHFAFQYQKTLHHNNKIPLAKQEVTRTIKVPRVLQHNATIPDVTAGCLRHVDNDTIHVIIMADNNAMVGMMALANSIVRNTKSPVMFHFVTYPYLHGTIRNWIKSSTLRNISYEILSFSRKRMVGKYLVRSPRTDLANPLNFARLFLTDMLPCLGRVVFIDADCIVLGDISELYHVQLSKNGMVAALNACHFDTGRNEQSLSQLLFNKNNPHIQAAGLPMDQCMMNGGVFVADLALWAQHNVSQQLQFWMELNTKETVFRYGDHGSGTQAVLNAVLLDKYTAIPREWNTVSGGHQTVPKPKLIHWNGAKKPWSHHKVAFQDLWRKYHVPKPAEQT